MLKKLSKDQKENGFSYIDGLKSKEFEALAMQLKLKRDFKNYNNWLKASQNYYSQLSESEKKRQLRHSSKTFINNPASISAEKSYSTSSYNKYDVPKNYSSSRSARPDANLKIKWKEKDVDQEKSAMKKAEEKMTEGWDPGQNLEVLPPDMKDKDTKHKL